ncbi:MAG: hypothetical protein JSU69_05865, partial [Candidatus Zixiibacteriota bacterium]
PVCYGAGARPNSVFPIDLDGDGDRDVVTTNYWSHDVAILFNLSGPYFTCGDTDGDQSVNILDVSQIINFLYRNGPPPRPMDSGDVNGSGNINLLDATYLINFLYKNGPEPGC